MHWLSVDYWFKKQGGSSVYPYQPAGLWDEISNKVWRYKYLQEPGEGLYRRSLYTVWKRTFTTTCYADFLMWEIEAHVKSDEFRPVLLCRRWFLLNDPQYPGGLQSVG